MTSYYYDFSIENGHPTALADPSYDGGNVYYGMDCLTYPSPSPTEQVVAGPLSPPEPLAPEPPSPILEEVEPQTISISTAFNPETHMSEPDIIFSSVDCVLFYADTHIIAKASPGAFQSLISAPSTPGAEYEAPPGSMRIIPVPESSIVLNIILHSLYGNSCAQYSPSLEALLEAVHHMPSYGISPSTHITRTTHLYSALLAYSPLHPLELYALAAQYKIHDLAVTTSSHLLSCSLSSITDELAERIGSIYLKRLFDLHLIRFNALREMLLSPPHPHPSTKDCNFVDQKGLTRAWALVSAYLAWDARADLSTHSMKLAFGPLAECLSCDDCKNCLQAKLHDVIAKWASVKRTI